MSSVIFSNVRIFDGTGVPSVPGEVKVEGNRISAVARDSGARIARDGAEVIDGQGDTDARHGGTSSSPYVPHLGLPRRQNYDAAELDAVAQMAEEAGVKLAAHSYSAESSPKKTSAASACCRRATTDFRTIRMAPTPGMPSSS